MLTWLQNLKCLESTVLWPLLLIIFQPVQLLSGQAQHGYVPQDSVRHYYFETSAKVDQFAVLLPH